MGSLYLSSYTMPIPEGAKISGNQVKWASKGKTKTGTLSGPGQVLIRSDTQIAKYTDEGGSVKKVSTKCTDKGQTANKFPL